MLKKLFGGLFTIILLLLVTTLSLVLIVRNVTSKDTINDMLNIFATNNNETINTDDITVEENMSETNIVDNNFSLVEKIQANTYKDVESGAILTDILQPEIPKMEVCNGQSKPRTIKLYGVCDLVLANKEELNNKVMKKEL